ncbi:protein FAR1-related sequence 5 [Tanacetum coccineum]
MDKVLWNRIIQVRYLVFLKKSVSSDVVDESCVPSGSSLNALTEEIVTYEKESDETHAVKSKFMSESENSFFSHFTNSGSTLMNFMNCFETAMEKQMHVQERMDYKTINIVPKFKTFLKIEHHASNVYTRSLFELVQKEIFVGLWHCQIDSKSLVEGSEVCIIKESPYVYEMPKKKKKKPQSFDKGKDEAEG